MKRRAVALLTLIVASTPGCARPGADAVSGRVVTIDGLDVPLSFEPDGIEVDAGSYTIVFTNSGQLPHQLALGPEEDARAGATGDTENVAGGDDASLKVDLEPGTYTYACYTDGHNLAGMTGELIVR